MEDGKAEGRAKGGEARARKLSEEERKAIAKKGAAARWGLKSFHKGNFKEHFGVDIECYVLDDEQKTAVISQRGMVEALGFSVGGIRLARFVSSTAMAPYVAELSEKLEKPLVFQYQTPRPSTPSSTAYGYDVAILIDICKAVVTAEADGKLYKRHKNVVRQAQIILTASAKAGIKVLVYALSGYDATKEEVISAFKMYVREEAREYEREFSEQLYAEWYRLYELPVPEHNRPWKFKHLTLEQVYRPLAKSNGKILQLTQARRASSDERYKKLHQFLSEIGVKALRQHLGQLLGIAQVSEDRAAYERHVTRIFGGQLSIEFPSADEAA